MIRDVVRAVLVLAVLAVGCEILAVHGQRRASPPPAWQPAPAPQWQQAAVVEPGPIRRVAREFVDLSEAFIGVIR